MFQEIEKIRGYITPNLIHGDVSEITRIYREKHDLDEHFMVSYQRVQRQLKKPARTLKADIDILKIAKEYVDNRKQSYESVLED